MISLGIVSDKKKSAAIPCVLTSLEFM